MPTGQEAPWRGRRITRTSWQKYFPPNWAPIPIFCVNLCISASSSVSLKPCPWSFPANDIFKYLNIKYFTSVISVFDDADFMHTDVMIQVNKWYLTFIWHHWLQVTNIMILQWWIKFRKEIIQDRSVVNWVFYLLWEVHPDNGLTPTWHISS